MPLYSQNPQRKFQMNPKKSIQPLGPKRRHKDIHPAKDDIELYHGLEVFIEKFNAERHQGIGRISPNAKYEQVA